MRRILVTGGTGFVGRALCTHLIDKGHDLTLAVRYNDLSTSEGHADVSRVVPVGEISPTTDWSEALSDIDVVVHLAARVHVMKEITAEPLIHFRAVNTAGTERLARVATEHGVKRLVFLSTVKVNGEATFGAAFTEKDAPAPEGPYAVAKWEAEQALSQIAEATGLEVVIIRPPLIYGPGAKGNFLRLLKCVAAGIPLPLASIQNQRSMVSLENLVDLISCCVEHPKAANQIFLVSDGHDVSTPELLGDMARLMGKKARLMPFPRGLLRAVLSAMGRGPDYDRLAGSLVIDPRALKATLGWKPSVSYEEGLRRTIAWFQEASR